MEILNPNSNISKITYPYFIWVIDDFLKDEVIERISHNWPESDNSAWHKGHNYINGKVNILERGMRGISKLELMPEKISEIAKNLHSEKFTEQLGHLLEIKDLIPDKAMRWSGMRTMLPNSFQLIHSDARFSPESSLRKELTVLFYTQPLFNEKSHTGQLEVWDDNMKKCIHKISPKYNRAIIFLNSDTSYHGVPEVNFERRSFTFSILKNAMATKRSKALFVARPTDSKDVREQGFNRSIIKDANI
ncbi:2OG-Fe(II) oxygenase [Prochlorococcus sp. MIT 0916]|uniref:2OG-Fe(II) oxygenase n=1 Tax=Prochlorococcus sp. MIT 0916 TaxID=3082521 RepID=UPI0039B380B6